MLGDIGKVVSIAVHPLYRGCGIGRRLLSNLIKKLFDDGVEVIRLEVRDSNIPAYRLYESLGFRQVGFIDGYYPDGERARIYEMQRKNGLRGANFGGADFEDASFV